MNQESNNNHMNNILFQLNTSININVNNFHFKTNKIENNNDRLEQYINGITKVIEYIDYLKENMDIYLTDNTNADVNTLDKTLFTLLESNSIKLDLSDNNKFGKFNKGAGVIEEWIHLKTILENYEWLIYFEPRQLLKNIDFIKTFIEKGESKENQFTIGKEGNHFNTGLFCIRTKTLFKYLDTINIDNFIKNNNALEYSLYNFFINNKIKYDKLDKMNLIRYENFLGKVYHM